MRRLALLTACAATMAGHPAAAGVAFARSATNPVECRVPTYAGSLSTVWAPDHESCKRWQKPLPSKAEQERQLARGLKLGADIRRKTAECQQEAWHRIAEAGPIPPETWAEAEFEQRLAEGCGQAARAYYGVRP